MSNKKNIEEETQKEDNNISTSNDDEIEQLKNEIEKLKESLARSQADYSNLLKRSEKEQEDNKIFIVSKVVGKILPFIDNLERAMDSIPEELKENKWIDGIKGIYNNILKQLESLDIKPYNSIGEEFDHNLHEVISQGPGKENIIILEIEKGYKLGEKAIRIAKVLVGNGQE